MLAFEKSCIDQNLFKLWEGSLWHIIEKKKQLSNDGPLGLVEVKLIIPI